MRKTLAVLGRIIRVQERKTKMLSENITKLVQYGNPDRTDSCL